MAETGSPDLDRILGFTIPGQHARGRVVRLGPVLAEILAAHGYPPPIERVLAEALTLTALVGAMLKQDQSQLTLQAQTKNGAIDLLVCDYRNGELRGYVRHDGDVLRTLGPEPALIDLLGTGYLAITFDQSITGERYQGIVPLEGETLAQAAESYFAQSEQIPSLARIGVAQGGREGCVAGGLLVQHLPEGEEGRERLHTRLDHPEWDHVRALAGTISAAELTDASLPLEEIVWRLFHEEDEVRVASNTPIVKGCRCNPDHIRDVLASFPEEERIGMADEFGNIAVDCAFCSRVFELPLAEIGR